MGKLANVLVGFVAIYQNRIYIGWTSFSLILWEFVIIHYFECLTLKSKIIRASRKSPKSRRMSLVIPLRLTIPIKTLQLILKKNPFEKPQVLHLIDLQPQTRKGVVVETNKEIRKQDNKKKQQIKIKNRDSGINQTIRNSVARGKEIVNKFLKMSRNKKKQLTLKLNYVLFLIK